MWNVWDTVEYEYEIWQHEVTSSLLAAEAPPLVYYVDPAAPYC